MSSQYDIITLRGLSARGHHGVFPFEREGTQTFSVDVSLWVDTRPAAATDDIGLTVSYADIAEEAVAVLTGPSVHLLETLASRVADVALAHPLVEGVEVTVHKPMAPLRQQFSDVSVTIRRGAAAGADADDHAVTALPLTAPDEGDTASQDPVGDAGPDSPPRRARSDVRTVGVDRSRWHGVVLALGGNLGDVPTTLARAVTALVDLEGIQVLDVSPLVRTRAVLAPDQEPQPDYWNAVVLARTALDPEELLAATSGIETLLGRVRHEHWGARTLDIDIVQYEGVTSSDPHLVLPHPRAHERAFVLVPWLLVDPAAELDGAGPVADLVRDAPDGAGVLDAVSDWLEDPGPVAAESDEVLAERSAVPVIQTPAGGSVVVSQETAAVGHPSRLDLVPEASRSGLRPSESGGDYLWHRLWEQWEGSTPEERAPSALAPADAGPAAGTGPAVGADRPSADAGVPVDTAPDVAPDGPGRAPEQARPAAGDGTTGSGEGTPQWSAPTGTAPGGEAPGGEAPTTQGSPGVPPGSTAGPGPQVAAAAQEGASTGPRRRSGMWVPLRRSADSTPGAGTPRTGAARTEDSGSPAPGSSAPGPRGGRAGGETPTEGNPPSGASDVPHPGVAGTGLPGGGEGGRPSPVHGRALPEWDFPSGERVRIVDDAADLRPLEGQQDEEQTPPATDGEDRPTPGRRSILKVDLPPGTPQGPLEHDPTTQTSILRGLTVRPTVTGQLPVQRRSHREGGRE